MASGIYVTYNHVSGDCYVGQSINVKRRWQQHQTRLAAGKVIPFYKLTEGY